MKWQTEKEVREAASKGELAALQSAIRHHFELSYCTAEQLREALKENETHLGESFCALCQRHLFGKCRNCCLKAKDTDETETCCSEYRNTNRIFMKWQCGNPTPENFAAFQQAERILLDRLCDEFDKMTKEPEKEKIIHKTGNRYQIESGEKYILAQAGIDEVALLDLRNGNRWRPPVRVQEAYHLSETEWSAVHGREFVFELIPKAEK